MLRYLDLCSLYVLYELFHKCNLFNVLCHLHVPVADKVEIMVNKDDTGGHTSSDDEMYYSGYSESSDNEHSYIVASRGIIIHIWIVTLNSCMKHSTTL